MPKRQKDSTRQIEKNNKSKRKCKKSLEDQKQEVDELLDRVEELLSKANKGKVCDLIPRESKLEVYVHPGKLTIEEQEELKHNIKGIQKMLLLAITRGRQNISYDIIGFIKKHAQLTPMIDAPYKSYTIRTPLMHAVSAHSITMVARLLSEGANPFKKISGHTALSICEDALNRSTTQEKIKNFEKIQKILKEAQDLWIQRKGLITEEIPEYRHNPQQPGESEIALQNATPVLEALDNQEWKSFLNPEVLEPLVEHKPTSPSENQDANRLLQSVESGLFAPITFTEDITNLYHAFDYQSGTYIFAQEQKELTPAQVIHIDTQPLDWLTWLTQKDDAEVTKVNQI